jgi:hypothetical protein
MGTIDFSKLEQAIGMSKFNSGNNLTDIINALIPYIFVFAGLILLVFLIMGGFQLMTCGGDPKATASAKAKITNALVGFLIVFVAYWVTQLMVAILGLPKGVI